MKKCSLVFLLFILAQELSAQSSKLYIQNHSAKGYVVYNYFSQDSLFSSQNETDSFVLDNENHQKTLFLFVNDVPSYNTIILDKDIINLSINTSENLEFNTETINTSYIIFQKGLRKLKNELAPKTEIDNYIYKYFYKNANLLLALDYAHASALYKIYSKDSCQALFDRLSPNLKSNELWAQTEKLLNQDIIVLQQEDFLPVFQVLNTKKQNINFEIKNKETIIIFWASWCSGCLKEIEQLKLNTDKFDKYSLILINLDKDVSKWIDAIEKLSLGSFTNYHLPNNFGNDMALAFKINGIPHHTLIDSAGKILKTNFELFQIKEHNQNVYFENNTYEINSKQINELKTFFEKINLKSIQNIELIGFANKIGKEENNLELSKNRIQNIKNFLIKTVGVNEYKITAKPLGEIDNNNLEENRKVSLTLNEIVLDFSQIGEADSCSFIFEYRQVLISPAGNKCLNEIIEKCRSQKNYTITIHTYSCGHEGIYSVNEQVSTLNYSEARAKVVRNFLLRNGIKEANIKTEAIGVDDSLETKDSDHSKKRRAEVVLAY